MFSKQNINSLPIEGTSHTSGSRQMILSKEQTSSKYFEALTYGFLPSKAKWEMHDHQNIIEICIVVKGQGVIRNTEGKEEKFKAGDRFVFPSNIKHEIENTSQEIDEFYFLRIQDQ